MSNYTLYQYCRRNLTSKIIELLEQYQEIDVLYEEGSFFIFAISKNNTEVVEALLSYFEKTQFPVKDNNYCYQLYKNKLREVLHETLDTYDISEEMQKIINSFISTDNDTDSRKSDCFLGIEGSERILQYTAKAEKNIQQSFSQESTHPNSEDTGSLLSESLLSEYISRNTHDVQGLRIYQAIQTLQSVYSKANDELAIKIARDFGMHSGDGNATHVRIWHKGIQKIVDIDSSMSAEIHGVHLSLNSIIKDITSSPEAIKCNLEDNIQHVNLSGCEYEYQGDSL